MLAAPGYRSRSPARPPRHIRLALVAACAILGPVLHTRRWAGCSLPAEGRLAEEHTPDANLTRSWCRPASAGAARITIAAAKLGDDQLRTADGTRDERDRRAAHTVTCRLVLSEL